jgi:flavorubredoxin
MREVSKTDINLKDIDVTISEITYGIYRISGFSNEFGITFNQFLINDEKPMLIHTGPIGMYKNIKEKIKEVMPLQKLAYVSLLHLKSDEWGGITFLESADAKLVCSDLSSKLNMMGWYNIPVDNISFWDNDILKTAKMEFKFIMTPHVHHWDGMMTFEESTKSLFTSGLFIQPGKNKPVISEDVSESMINLYRGAWIFASEKPVRNITIRLVDLSPNLVCLMNGSCIDKSLFSRYTEAIMKNEFAYSGILLGQNIETTIA